jgi:pimeloyl-ACP methyl ester carboxylesterase
VARAVFSSTPTFQFETVRVLWSAPFDGADLGEVITAVRSVRRADFESWHASWSRLAREVTSRAEGIAHPVSRGKALLRASTYWRAAEFYLTPTDPRRVEASRSARACFDRALSTLGVRATRSRVPYADAEMETIFLRASGPDRHGVLVVHGGFDSTLEEMYFVVGAGAAQRGFDVLIYEGPGQGNLLRSHNMPFIPEWERPASAALDALREHGASGPIIGVGVSFGGHLLARAAAFEKRFDGIVLFDYFPGMLEAFKYRIPATLRGSFERMPRWMRLLVQLRSYCDPELRWALRNARWVFDADTLPELVSSIRQYDDRAWARQIESEVLILLGQDEHFFDKNLGYSFARGLVNARSVTVHEFSKESGGGLHCQNGAIHVAHEVIFDWACATSERVRGRFDKPTNDTPGDEIHERAHSAEKRGEGRSR